MLGGGGQLCTQDEHLPLHLQHPVVPTRFGDQAGASQAQRGARLVDGSVGVGAQIVFVHAPAVQQAGRPVVAPPRVDLHGRVSSPAPGSPERWKAAGATSIRSP